jgi:hypothetical protein
MGRAAAGYDDLKPVRIGIDSFVREKYGPELCWTFRLLLSSMGVPWLEVSPDDPACDVAYVRAIDSRRPCALQIRADVSRWDRRSSLRLTSVQRADGWRLPSFESRHSVDNPISISDGQMVCEHDVLFDIFWLATGQEEVHWRGNAHGHLRAEAPFPRDVFPVALASHIGRRLEQAFEQLGLPTGEPRWPGAARAAACLTHDVDYPQAVRWLEPFRRLHRDGRHAVRPALALVVKAKTHWHFDSWLQLEQSVEARSAFYFVPRQGSLWEYAAGTPDPFYDVTSPRFRALFRSLTDAGAEVALHASYRAHESPDRLAMEKQKLEEVSGQKIEGVRHHYLHLDPADPESTLLLHEAVGLKHDSSLAHERYVGWRRALSWPFFPFHPRERREVKTLQLPLAWMDAQLFRYRADNPGDRADVLKALADHCVGQGGCLVIDVHEYVYDEELFPGWARAYRELLAYIKARGDFWVDTPRRVAEHWSARHARVVERSQGLDA